MAMRELEFSFKKNKNKLIMENKIYFIPVFLLAVLLSGCIEDPEFSDALKGGGKPVFKDGITLIAKTASSMEFSAEILRENGYKITERGFVWSTSQNKNPTVENGNKITSGTGIGVYTCKLENLNGNTTYYIRPYAINGQGIEYGSSVLEETTDNGLGMVTTNKWTEVHAASATAGGTVVSAGESEIIRRGIYYSQSKMFLTKDSVMSEDIADTYHCHLTDLSLSTKYYYVAFAANKFGTFEGETDSLTTLNGLPKIGLTESRNPGYNEVTLFSIVSNEDDTTVQIIERGFYWGTSSDLTTVGDTVHAGAGNGAFESVIRNLEAGKQYYARAYAKSQFRQGDSDGTVHSETVPFNTIADLPTVRTGEIENLEKAKVDLSCTVINSGKSAILSAGICWSLTNKTPTLSDGRLSLILGIGNRYSGQMTGLRGGVTYYIRAYATNGEGTSYGEIKQFTTPSAYRTGFKPFPGGYLLQKSNAYFSIGNDFYIVGGDRGPDFSGELWKYSVTEDSWQHLKSLTSGPAKWQTGVAYGMGAFVFGGLGENGIEKNSFMYYDVPPKNDWRAYPSGIDSIHSAISFSSGNSVYIIGGQSGGTVKQTVWRYDMVSNAWTRMTDFPEIQYGGIAVIINNVVYAGLGKGPKDLCNGNIYVTEDGANTWWGKVFLSIYVGGILGGVACNESVYVIDEEFYIYEFITKENSWTTRMRRIPETHRHFNCIFENDGKIYIGFGSDDSFVVYDPVWDN
jgi:hypothetical protein